MATGSSSLTAIAIAAGTVAGTVLIQQSLDQQVDDDDV